MPDKETKRILITGASGFIGGYLVQEAVKKGYEVYAAIRKNSNTSRLKQKDIRLIEIDYTNPEAIARMCDQLAPSAEEPAFHYVVHNAGVTKVKNLSDFREINAENTRRLIEGLSKSLQPPLHFVLMSSMGSYGATPNNTDPLYCTDPQNPCTEYGRSKLLAEQYITQSKLRYSILMPTGVYGPGDKDYLMAIKAINKGFDFITGPTPQMLTFVYGEDVARAALFILDKPESIGQRYIVSDGNTYTDMEFGRLVQKILGRKRVLHLRVPLHFVKLGCHLGQRWGDLTGNILPLNKDKYAILAQRNWRCDASPLFLLGFKPLYDLEKGIRETVKYARDHKLL
ncbi:NAD(P)-dependent oxidoreductase [Porphyromonas pogonae]|uniref:NAD-dependent epimerase/dehydratase family protein n=1 Tax=Porphyromonas pogonae TaxID=867595 RepID=UPI002E75E894|nr:NAD(P)-dependent oxidoreductase [Porphyromonas pogonae]